MVLPAPVGPTIATVWPGSRDERQVLDQRHVGVVAERHVLERHEPARLVRGHGSAGSRRPAPRRRAARRRARPRRRPDCSTLDIEATCVSGWLNWREYWMNACTSPRLMRARRDAQAADDRDEHVVEVPDEHDRRQDDARQELGAEAGLVELVVALAEALLGLVLAAEDLARAAWPVKLSSMCALSRPVCAHCATNSGCERLRDQPRSRRPTAAP